MGLLDILHDYKLRAFDTLDAPEMADLVIDGTEGSTTYTYVATCETLVGETVAAQPISTDVGPDVLDGNNRIKLGVKEIPAAVAKIRFFKLSGESYGFIGEETPAVGYLWDTGQTIQTSIQPPDENTSGRPDWLMLLPHTGRRLQRAEVADMQALLLKAIRNLADTIHRNGDVIRGCTERKLQDYLPARTVSDATNATPIVITTSEAHGYTDDLIVEISEVEGNTAANGTFKVANATATTFELIDPDTGEDIAGNGDYTSGGTSVVAANQWEFTEGVVYVDGFQIPVPTGRLKLVGSGTERVGITVTPQADTYLTDSVLRDPDSAGNWKTYGREGTDRLIVQVAWALDTDGQIEIREFIDGEPKQVIIPTERTELVKMLAQRTDDISGSFVVRNFPVKIRAHPTDEDKMVARIGPGQAYPEGYRVETKKPRPLDLDRAREVEARNNSTTDPANIIGGTVLGTESENFDVDGLKVKLRCGGGNSHTVTFSGDGKTAAQVVSDIESAINAYPTSGDLVDCVDADGKLQIKALDGKPLHVETVDSDAYTVLGISTGTYDPTGQRIYPINEDYVKEVTDLSYFCEVVEQVTHDGGTHIDELAHTGVSQIIGASDAEADCHDGKWDYQNGVDFGRTGNSIDFSLYGGEEPSHGATYYVKYRYSRNAVKGSRVLVEVIDAQITKGAEDGQDTIVFTGATSAKKVSNGEDVSGLSGNASDVTEILRVNNSPGQGSSQYNSYSLIKNSADEPGLEFGPSQIDWSAAGAQGETPGGQPTTSATYYMSFRFWHHAVAGDFATADSYDLYEEIEEAPGGALHLRDSIDFRGNTANLPIPDGTILFDYEFYLSRIDKITISPEADLEVIRGVAAKAPGVPEDQSGTLTLAVILVPPYTYSVADCHVRSTEPLRTTQRGILELKHRVEHLEYLALQNDLERETAATEVAIGAQGVFTDPLLDHGRMDVGFNKNGSKHTAALDLVNNCLRLPVTRDAKVIEVDLNSSSHIREAGNSLMLDFQPSLLQEQLKASTTINVNPDEVFSFRNGNLDLDPSMDIFFDEQQLVDMDVDLDSALAGLRDELPTEEQVDITWGAWQSNFGARNDPTRDPHYSQTPGGTGHVIFRTGTQMTKTPERKELDLGDRVVDITVAPMMRTTDDQGDPFEIACDVTAVMPNMDYGCEIDGVPVDFTATGDSEQGSLTYQGKATVAADSSGSLTGKFTMPAGIAVGQRVVNVCTASDPEISTAQARFSSQGFVEQHQRTSMGFTSLRVREETITERYYQNYVDPLAQTFIVPAPNTYICGVGVYFASKSATIPITCEMREVLNGYPTRNVLASKTLQPENVDVSDDGSVETQFIFDQVLGYSNTEFCFVLLTNCTDYEVYIAEIGSVDLLTNEIIAAQAHGGVLFHSPNGATWEAMTRHDMKFRLYKSNFENDCQIVFQNLTGIEASLVALMVEQFLAPGTNISWSYSLDGGSTWVPFLPIIDTELGSVATQVKLRVDVTSSGGTFEIIHRYAGIMLLLNQLSADAIFNQQTFLDPLAYPAKIRIIADLDADGTGGTGTRSVTPHYSIDDGETWVEVKDSGATPVATEGPYYEYQFETPDQASVSGATNATPIVITSSDHGFQDNAIVEIADVGGNTAANGTWRVANADDDTFELVDPDTGDDSVGNGDYTSGGTIDLKPFAECRMRLNLTTTNQAQTPRVKRPRMICTEAA